MRLSLLRRTAALVAVSLLVLTGGFALLLHARLQHDVGVVLQSRARSAMALVVLDQGRLAVEETPLDETVETSFWLFDGAGATVTRPLVDSGTQRAAESLTRRGGLADHDGLRLLASPVVIDGQRLGTIVVGVPVAPFLSSERPSLVGALLIDLLVLLGAISLTNRAVRGALGPVEEMTATARRWSVHDDGRRFPVTGNDEIGHLAATLNSLLDRVAAAVRHEQRLTADIAHELKTPLARMHSTAEVASRYGADVDRRRAVEDVIAESARLGNIIDRLLSRVTVGEHAFCDARRVVEAHALRLRSVGGAPRVEVGGLPVVVVGCNAAALDRMLGPLTANGLKHARSRVGLTVTNAGQHAVIEVVDDGVGCITGERDRLFEPGFRGSRAVGSGQGLGLALARRLAEEGGGAVEIGASEGGQVRLLIPLHPWQ